MRIFLDANILFSAAKSDGAIRELLRQCLATGHELWVDSYVVEEARRNVKSKYPESGPTLDTLLSAFRIGPAPGPFEVDEALDWLPEKDRFVMVSAIRHQCDALMTGDRRHFGARFGQRVGGVWVCSPQEAAQVPLR